MNIMAWKTKLSNTSRLKWVSNEYLSIKLVLTGAITAFHNKFDEYYEMALNVFVNFVKFVVIEKLKARL